MPKISVIIPVYNGEKYIKKAINSILNQTYTDFELLLIDDCSTDKTMSVVEEIKDPRIKIIHNKKNMGIADSRNIGLKNATGEYIALMDDDDITVPERFEKQVCFLDKHKDIDVVGGRYGVIDKDDKLIRLYAEPLNNPNYIRAYMMLYDPIGNGSAMFHNSLIRENNILYQNNCFGMEDYHFWINCSLYGKITNLPDVFLYWRYTKDNETNRTNTFIKEKRAEKFAQLHRYAFEQNGYYLTDNEFEIVNRLFPEDLKSIWATKEDVKKLHTIFLKIINQAKELNVCNAKEVEVMCKKLFSFRMEYSEIWSDSSV